MENTIYQIIHAYDEDGGFGDAISCEDVIGAFSDESVAKAYVDRWSNPHVYDKPYAELWCGELYVKPLKINTLDLDTKPSLGAWFGMGDDDGAFDEEYEETADDTDNKDEADSLDKYEELAESYTGRKLW